MNNINEFWKDIPGYEGLYEVSNLGNVKSLRNGRILKPKNSNHGYLFISPWKNGKHKNHYVHRLVAQAFLPNPNNLPEVNHKDNNKLNNNVDNLEWCDRKYNATYSLAKEVGQYDLSGNLIKVWPSINEAARQLGFSSSSSSISACCLGIYKTSHGYIWKYI